MMSARAFHGLACKQEVVDRVERLRIAERQGGTQTGVGGREVDGALLALPPKQKFYSLLRYAHCSNSDYPAHCKRSYP